MRPDTERLPEWADAKAPGRCGCGAALVKVDCAYCRGHIVCRKSGWDVERCPVADLSVSEEPER